VSQVTPNKTWFDCFYWNCKIIGEIGDIWRNISISSHNLCIFKLFQSFFNKDFKYTKILKEWCSKHTYIDLIDSIINNLLYLLYHISVFAIIYIYIYLCVVQWVMSNSLWPHESQHARLPCPSPTPRVSPNSCPSSQWCHPAISSSVVPFSSYPQ